MPDVSAADDGPAGERAVDTRQPPHPKTLNFLLGPIVALWLAARVADASWATLHEDHPLALIALSSINRYLILVADQLDAVSYYVVGTARLLIADPLFFLLGYWYGDRALDWADKNSPTFGPLLRAGQGWFGKAAWPLVLIAPNNPVCLFAGAAGMRIPVFYALNLVGTVVRLFFIRELGQTFSSPIDAFRDFVGDYQLWFLGASIIAVVFVVWNEVRSGQFEELRHLDEPDDDTEHDATEPRDSAAEGDET